MDAPAHQLAAYFIELDCQIHGCRGSRTYQVGGLAMIYRAETMRDLMRLYSSTKGYKGTLLSNTIVLAEAL